MDKRGYINYIANKFKEKTDFFLKDQALGLATILFSKFSVEHPGVCEIIEYNNIIGIHFNLDLAELGINIDKSKLDHPQNIYNNSIILYPSSTKDLVIIGNEIYKEKQ